MRAHDAGQPLVTHREPTLPITSIPDALVAWREAERRWESTTAADPGYGSAAIGVISAWLRYQELTDREPASFLLVADDDHRYVAVGGDVRSALGYAPEELLGLRIEDLAAPDLAAGTPAAWQQFLADGRQDGDFRLMTRDGREVSMRFQARAHHPIPGFHTSRLRPA
jgi:PAS domain S-box-containing protein